MKIIKSPVHTLAEENDLKVLTPQIFDNEIIYDFKKIQPDLIIVVAYGKILPKNFRTTKIRLYQYSFVYLTKMAVHTN